MDSRRAAGGSGGDFAAKPPAVLLGALRLLKQLGHLVPQEPNRVDRKRMDNR